MKNAIIKLSLDSEDVELLLQSLELYETIIEDDDDDDETEAVHDLKTYIKQKQRNYDFEDDEDDDDNI